MVDRLYTIDEAAELLRSNVPTLRNWRTRHVGPRSIKIGKRVMYREVDLQAYISGLAAEADRGIEA